MNSQVGIILSDKSLSDEIIALRYNITEKHLSSRAINWSGPIKIIITSILDVTYCCWNVTITEKHLLPMLQMAYQLHSPKHFRLFDLGTAKVGFL